MSNAGRLLVVEDHESERKAVSQLLKSEGFQVFGAESADKALGYIDENIDVVLTDLNMGDVSGIDLLSLWKQRKPETQFILLTGNSSVNSAVDAIRKGAYDYVTKPVNPDELTLIIKRAIEGMRKDKEIDQLRRRLDQKFGLDQIIGSSKAMRDVFAKIQRAAPVDSTVLVLGESGTGKELVAQALHHNSTRKKGPFVAVNIAAVPPSLVESELFGHVRGAFTGATDRRMGRFEQADGGTLFIDEVGDFELSLQAKLLRVLETFTVTPVGGHEDRKVDVRVLAATSRDIRKMVGEGTFREDLYYRLNVVTILLPPLRDRPDDVPLLVEHFLKEITEKKHTAIRRVSPEVMRRFQNYPWPGNVRELRNILESMMVLADGELLTENDLPDSIAEAAREGAAAKDIPTGLTGFTAKDLWQHCIAVAVTARELARQMKLPIADEAFLAGLIHDIGILVSLHVSPEKLRTVCERVRAENGDFCSIEREITGFDHQELGLGLTEQWKFTRSCQLVAGFHHNPQALSDSSRLLVTLVYVADTVCCQSNRGFNLTSLNQKLSEGGISDLDISPAVIEKVTANLDTLVQSATSILG